MRFQLRSNIDDLFPSQWTSFANQSHLNSLFLERKELIDNRRELSRCKKCPGWYLLVLFLSFLFRRDRNISQSASFVSTFPDNHTESSARKKRFVVTNVLNYPQNTNVDSSEHVQQYLLCVCFCFLLRIFRRFYQTTRWIERERTSLMYSLCSCPSIR